MAIARKTVKPISIIFLLLEKTRVIFQVSTTLRKNNIRKHLVKNLMQGYFQANQLLPLLTARLSYLKRLKARAQRVLGALDFRFLGHERPPETLKWEHLTINKSSSESSRLPLKTWINSNSSREVLKSRLKSNRVESFYHSTARSRSHELAGKSWLCSNRLEISLAEDVI